jgi:hypothetical protein
VGKSSEARSLRLAWSNSARPCLKKKNKKWGAGMRGEAKKRIVCTSHEVHELGMDRGKSGVLKMVSP